MIDTHCHLYNEYYDNLDLLIDKIKAAGISAVIVNGCDMKSNLEVLELVRKYDIVYGAIGFQPTELNDVTDNDLEWLKLHINDDKIIALGEIGLDYHYEDTDKEKQIYFFKKQLDIASMYNKPIIVHTRDSIQDTFDILNTYKLRGSIHCYTGSVEMARKFINLGFYLGIGGVVTFKNAKNIIKVIEEIDLEYILLETDSPYLTPEPYRKYKNDSSYLPLIIDKIANIKKTNNSIVKSITTTNATSLFDIKLKI